MIIELSKIEKAVLSGSAREAAELCNLPIQTIRQYRSAAGSSSFRDWKKMSLLKAIEISKNLELKKE